MVGRSYHVPHEVFSPPPPRRIRLDWERVTTLSAALATQVPYHKSTGPLVTLAWLGQHDPGRLDDILGGYDPAAPGHSERVFYALVRAAEHYRVAIAVADAERVAANAVPKPRARRAVVAAV